MYKDKIEDHIKIIRNIIQQDQDLKNGLIKLINTLSLNSEIRSLIDDIKEMGSASKAVYFMQLKNRCTNTDLFSLFIDSEQKIITSITDYESEIK